MSSLVKRNLSLLVVGFGCCKQEIFSTDGPLYDIQRFGINFVNVPEDADILVIQGFFNEIGEERLINLYNRMHNPKWAIAVGKCVVTNNLFCREYRLLDRLRGKIHIDVFVPGCPPRPEAFIYSILRLLDKDQREEV